jgi:hypothetical protein
MKHVLDAVTKLVVFTILGTNFAFADALSFPAPDITAPVIEQNEFINKIQPGKDHRIRVTATDNVAIKSVVVYYREIGATEYQTRTMRKIGDSDEYAVNFTADELSGDGIEYYIQAADQAGNTLLLGYAFSPLVVTIDRQIANKHVATVAEPAEKNIKAENSYSKWLWIGLGVLAVGAIASGGGGGDDGGGASQEPSVTINAPVP